MKTYSDEKMKVIETLPNGANYYRYDFKEIINEDPISQSTKATWECEEIVVWSPLSSDKITSAVIEDKWGLNYENKLLNDYYGAIEGILSIEKKQPYIDFLEERKRIKLQISLDCQANGIV